MNQFSIKDVVSYFEKHSFNRAKLLEAPKEYKKYLWETLWVYSCGIGEYENDGEVVDFEFQNGDITIRINKFNLVSLEEHEKKVMLTLSPLIGVNKNGSIKLELFTI